MKAILNGARRLYVDVKAGCIPAQIAGLFFLMLTVSIGYGIFA